MEYLRWNWLSEFVALLVELDVQAVLSETRVVPLAVQCPLAPQDLQSPDSGKMSAVVPTSCGRRLR